MNIFLATEKDALDLLYLQELNFSDLSKNSLKTLFQNLNDKEKVWFIYKNGSDLKGAMLFLIDNSQKLVKLHQALLKDHSQKDIFSELLDFSLKYFERDFDLIYSTTRGISPELQELTINAGFKVLGIFPNALGLDKTRVNGLTAYYFGDAIKKRLFHNISIHKLVKPIFEIVRRQITLESPNVVMPICSEKEGEDIRLELIQEAPQFVFSRFMKLYQKKSSAVHFYPFQIPNVLAISPNEEIEIFIKIIPKLRFAAIIGEKMEESVNPIMLYESVLNLLNENGVTYVEMINDASDVNSIDSLIRAGFLPCAYVPAFKLVEKDRRDYIVLSKAFEKRTKVSFSGLHPLYREFFNEYVKLEESLILGNFSLYD